MARAGDVSIPNLSYVGFQTVLRSNTFIERESCVPPCPNPALHQLSGAFQDQASEITLHAKEFYA